MYGSSGASSVASSNGFAGSVSGGVATIRTSVTGILKGNGTSVVAAVYADLPVPTAGSISSSMLAASPTFTGTTGTAALSSTGIATFSQAGALSASAINITGAIVATGGSGTTTLPLIYVNQGVSQPTTWSTTGTALGFNLLSGFGGNVIDVHINGAASIFKINSSGSITSAGSGSFSGGGIVTQAPSGGTSGTWKLGILVTTASTFDTTKYIQLDVGGTLYKLATCS